jgi:hypothetical protein
MCIGILGNQPNTIHWWGLHGALDIVGIDVKHFKVKVLVANAMRLLHLEHLHRC